MLRILCARQLASAAFFDLGSFEAPGRPLQKFSTHISGPLIVEVLRAMVFGPMRTLLTKPLLHGPSVRRRTYCWQRTPLGQKTRISNRQRLDLSVGVTGGCSHRARRSLDSMQEGQPCRLAAP